ncbi:MAG: RNA polymerase subunit sigma-24 [Myxococcales bacterium]|nr:RNA polymerase subunit sigma-24 [Myxococcales bacterium]|tara:strand:+ start:2151 stop:2807 length:657 start_codon:yes stop_codon:yes gene_type:complete
MNRETNTHTPAEAFPLVPMEQAADELLIKRSLKGDYEAFNHLTRRYMNAVFSIAVRMLRHREDAEDVVQQTFLAALENLHQFRFEAAFSTWLIRIATNKCLKLIKKRKKASEVKSLNEDTEESWEMNSLPDAVSAMAQSPEELVHNSEIRVMWQKALSQLSETYRPVYILRDIQGFSTAETAEMLQVSESNVKIRLMRARLTLQKKISQALNKGKTPP